jgi:hypothetical protein
MCLTIPYFKIIRIYFSGAGINGKRSNKDFKYEWQISWWSLFF